MACIWRDWSFLLKSFSKPQVHEYFYQEKIFIKESTHKCVWNYLMYVLQNCFNFPCLKDIFPVHAKLLQINISLEPLNFYLCFHSAQENEVRLIHGIYILPTQLKQQSRFRGEEKGGIIWDFSQGKLSNNN